MAVDTLLDGLGARWVRPPAGPAPLIDEITLDLNEVRPGVLFIARRAWWGDTHGQLAAAARRGASALVVSRAEAAPAGVTVPVACVAADDPFLGHLAARFYGHPTRSLEVVGVTGTNGKTSTTWIVAALWAALGRRPARMGTLGYAACGQHLAASNTTPDALVIQRFARDALDLGADCLVLEVSSHALALGRIAGVAFDAVGFTQLGRDHLDFHKSLASYEAAKARLFDDALRDSLAAGKAPRAAAWLPDPASARMLARVPPGALRVGVGTAPPPAGTPCDAALWVSAQAPQGLAGTDLVLQAAGLGLDGADIAARVALPGDHDVANAALALALVARDLPTLRRGAQALASLPPVPGRMEQAAPDVWVDYAHTPDAVARIIAAVRARAPAAPLTVVLGCGGDRDRGKRPLMARAAEAADAVWLTADNPRSEAIDDILAELVAGCTRPAHVVPDRATAIAQAMAQPGIVLLLGKGHEQTQQVGPTAWRFDDREVARRIATARRAGVAPAQALIAWGLADGAPPLTVLTAARTAPGGLWVLTGPPDTAALTARFADRWLACALAEVPTRLAAHHRALVLTDAAPGVPIDGQGVPPPGPPPPPPAPADGPHLPSLVSRRPA